MSADNWKQRFVIDRVDIFAWGARVDDLYAQRNSRLVLYTHDSGIVSICIVGDHPDDVLLVEMSKLVSIATFRRPTGLVLTYRNVAVGLNITFPTTQSLDTFVFYVKSYTAPDAHCSYRHPVSYPPISPKDLRYTGEEDITAAYQRSFISGHTYRTCDFLYVEPQGSSDETASLVSESEWYECDAGGAEWDEGRRISDDGKEDIRGGPDSDERLVFEPEGCGANSTGEQSSRETAPYWSTAGMLDLSDIVNSVECAWPIIEAAT